MPPLFSTWLRPLIAAAGVAAAGAASAAPFADDFAVFVDPPTRFAFVNVPGPGWTFVSQLSPAQAAQLPAGTLTVALPAEPTGVFVDDASGFVFARTPDGWRYVRQIAARERGHVRDELVH